MNIIYETSHPFVDRDDAAASPRCHLPSRGARRGGGRPSRLAGPAPPSRGLGRDMAKLASGQFHITWAPLLLRCAAALARDLCMSRPPAAAWAGTGAETPRGPTTGSAVVSWWSWCTAAEAPPRPAYAPPRHAPTQGGPKHQDDALGARDAAELRTKLNVHA